jgi:hypothetical protein
MAQLSRFLFIFINIGLPTSDKNLRFQFLFSCCREQYVVQDKSVTR